MYKGFAKKTFANLHKKIQFCVPAIQTKSKRYQIIVT